MAKHSARHRRADRPRATMARRAFTEDLAAMIARQRLEILPAAGSGDAVETDLEVVAVPDIEVLLVVPPCADP